jgi:2-dehydro-3-deoxygluconokinase
MSAHARVVTFGETMALFSGAGIGSLAQIRDVTVGIGGAESNVAIGLARLGTPVTWLGRVGDDSLGTRIVREIRGEGVDVRAIVDATSPTGVMLKERRTAEVTRVLYYRASSAGSRVGRTDVETLGIDAGTVLHVTGITPALSAAAADAVDAAIDRARASGALVSFDVNHRATLWAGRDAAPIYRRIAERADVVFAGVDEARLLTGSAAGDLELARAISGLGPSQAILKLGADGCVAVVDGAQYRQAAAAIRPLDTVGAGDGFVAGYLAELVAGLPVQGRLTTAVTAGTLVCLTHGDWEGLPTRRELQLLHADDPVVR